VLGVSALLVASPTAFLLLKWLGGAYLVWLGIQAWRSTGAGPVATTVAGDGSLRNLFLKGLIANAINPKVVLFFLSFLPQFVVESPARVDVQLGLLGLLFTVQAAILFALLGHFSGSVGAWLNRQPSASQWLDRVAGTVFIGLGIRMIASR